MLIFSRVHVSLIFNNNSLPYVNHFVKGEDNARVADRRDLVDDLSFGVVILKTDPS
jgi:hypothetical protein